MTGINSKFPDLKKYSQSRGANCENLVKAYEIESVFHKKILAEESFDKRQQLYADVYNAVHPLYGKSNSNSRSYDRLVRLFKKELKDKSVLDVGCGEGLFLTSIAANLPHKKLVGMDVSIPHLPHNQSNIEFKMGNVVDFDLNEQFDVVFSNHVLEHIAPADMSFHLSSVRNAMKDDGVFIFNAPNRLFGPWDVTRIIDYSNTGKTMAQGTHINESTYSEIIPILEQNGFENFKTVCFISKLKYYLGTNFRYSPSILCFIEHHSFFLNLLYLSKLVGMQGRCIAYFDISLICNKKL
ncbi:class I SAM-dependent methyltransferase [Candidatus Symbiothrix dinenymphae]|uniref:class I SAM-dependent methyltransferase n=1 Tax=Candidatus Symbiothrix dinenymphae TaxID=467085 RepID=UPI000702C96B|nr:class I SAM-dependent methyltransferase [Candidatus Symbiothrix dinenymphae]